MFCRLLFVVNIDILVFCKKCKTDLGWKYEYTKNDEQRYKEGKYVLEVECLKSIGGLLPVSTIRQNDTGWREEHPGSESDSEVQDDEPQFQIHLDL